MPNVLLTAFVLAPHVVPQPTPVAPPGLDILGTVLNWLMYIGIVAVVAGIIGVGIRMGGRSMSDHHQPIGGMFLTVLLGGVIVGGAAAIANAVI